MNIRNVQQAVRGHMNMNNTSVTPTSAEVFGATAYLPAASCPAGTAAYTYSAGAALATGTLALTCTQDTTHLPAAYDTW